MPKLILLSCFLIWTLSSHAQPKWPAVTQTTKPWIRWWWEGSAVNKEDLSWNLQQYQQAGLGGTEITPIYGVHGYEKQFIQFLSPAWMDAFDHTLKVSKQLGLGVDLANATGWPFGGPWVTDADASKTVYYKTYILSGGQQLEEIISYDQQTLIRTADDRPVGIDSILRPVSMNKNLQILALDQIQYPELLPLQSVIAYSDNKKVIDLTAKVNADGKLTWTAPPGNWTLYALFEGLHGKMVERAAPGGEGYAIDHFSAAAANHYFSKFDQAFKGHDISYLRSFFNDSYEVDDARGQANWTPGFLAAFKKSKGYDLKEHLPALFGKDDPDNNSRVIYDYRSVIDELLLQNFTMNWKKWAVTKGAMVRNQSHGSPANTLDLYSVVDIPETEGNDILRFKFATSAAHVSGKPLASSESATWLNEHFLSSWGDVKKAIDLYFLGGVNHIFYHGSAYSPKDAPWPGWLFYAAVHFQPSNPQWKDFHALNTYITRVQSFLQTGKPDNEVLLYYPIVDRYSEPGNTLLQHFDGMQRNFEKTDFEDVSKWMLDKGYSFDFFSDRQLQKFTVSNNTIQTGGNTYQTILLPANKLIPEASLAKLLQLARQGARILVYKKLPADVPGLGQLDKRRNIFHGLMAQLHFTGKGKIQEAVLGKGMILMGDDMKDLLEAGAVDREDFNEKGLEFIKRNNADGPTYFITNRSDKAIDGWIPLHTTAASIVFFDPMTGNLGLGKMSRKDPKEPPKVYIRLESYESLIIRGYEKVQVGKNFPYYSAGGNEGKLKGDWNIEFISGGPVLPTNITGIKKPELWTDLDGDAVKNFSGTAKYTTTFERPKDNAVAWSLNLGKVNETAEVILNGKSIATLIGPDFTVVIPDADIQPVNKLEIIVANLMANRIAYMDRNNLPWKIFYNTNMPARKRENVKNGLFDASAWKPLPSGLEGPVTITALKSND